MEEKFEKTNGFQSGLHTYILREISVGHFTSYDELEIQIGPKLFVRFAFVSGLTELGKFGEIRATRAES